LIVVLQCLIDMALPQMKDFNRLGINTTLCIDSTGWNIMISEFNQIKHTLECLRSWTKNSWSSQSWKCLNGKSWIYLHRIMLPHNLAETIWVVNGDGFTVSYGYGTTSDERNQYNNYFNLHQNIPMYHIGWNIMI
jgi:hypothetical protein